MKKSTTFINDMLLNFSILPTLIHSKCKLGMIKLVYEAVPKNLITSCIANVLCLNKW